MNTNHKLLTVRIAAVVAVIVTLFFGGTAISRVAAQSVLPGDTFYPVKTSIEQARLSLTRDAGDRAEMKLEFAEQRLREIELLIQEGRYQEVNSVVLAFETDINNAIIEVESIGSSDPSRASELALKITSALSHFSSILGKLKNEAPETVKDEINRALDSANVASGLEMTDTKDDDPSHSNDNGNVNENANTNEVMIGTLNVNGNFNVNGDDSLNENINSNGNENVNSSFDQNENSSQGSDDGSQDTSGSLYESSSGSPDNGSADDHGNDAGSSEDSGGDHGGDSGSGED